MKQCYRSISVPLTEQRRPCCQCACCGRGHARMQERLTLAAVPAVPRCACCAADVELERAVEEIAEHDAARAEAAIAEVGCVFDSTVNTD